jgi:hypothetical protein
MAKMKAVQPEMASIRERYGDDKMKQQQALMELYKKEKINPLAGCLPIVVQIPVFFSLYKVLFVTIEMRHAPFFGWIHDLSPVDPTNIFWQMRRTNLASTRSSSRASRFLTLTATLRIVTWLWRFCHLGMGPSSRLPFSIRLRTAPMTLLKRNSPRRPCVSFSHPRSSHARAAGDSGSLYTVQVLSSRIPSPRSGMC